MATRPSRVQPAHAFHYTGRENEGNGLYFYRNRYYSPLLGRFVNEDPLGLGGGDANLYAYVFGSPTNLSDPMGLFSEPALSLFAGGGAGTSLTLIQGGPAAISGTVVETGSAGGPLGVAALAIGATVYVEASTANAELNANAAYDEEWQSVIAYNDAILAHPRPSTTSLAGRYTGHKKSPNECRQQLQECIEQCSDELRKGEWPFRRCVAKCMDDAGCDYTIPRPFYNPPLR